MGEADEPKKTVLARASEDAMVVDMGCGAMPAVVVDRANHKKVTGIFEDAGRHSA